MGPSLSIQADKHGNLRAYVCDAVGLPGRGLMQLGKRRADVHAVLDGCIGNAHWREDEYRAFQEAVASYGWRYDLLCFSVFTKQVALRILG